MSVASVQLCYYPASSERSTAIAEAALLTRSMQFGKLELSSYTHDDGQVISFDIDERADHVTVEQPITIQVQRDHTGQFRVTFVSLHGQTTGNHGPDPKVMLSELVHFLSMNDGGNFLLIDLDSGQVI